MCIYKGGNHKNLRAKLKISITPYDIYSQMTQNIVIGTFNGQFQEYTAQQAHLTTMKQTKCSRALTQILIAHYSDLLFVVLFVLFQLYPAYVHLAISLSVLLLYETTQVMRKYRLYKFCIIVKLNMYLLELTDHLIKSTFIACLVFVQAVGYKYYPLGSIFVVQLFLRLIYYFLYRRLSRFMASFAFLQCAVTLLLCSAYLTIALKVDGMVNMRWEEGFWWFWIFFGSSLALTLICFLLLANHYISLAFGDPVQHERNEIKQIVWCLTLALFLTLFSYTWVLGTTEYLNNGSPLKLYISLCVIAQHAILFGFLSWRWRYYIIDLLVKVIFDEAAVEPPKRKDQPRFLQRLSDGYFRVIESTKKLFQRQSTPELQSVASKKRNFIDNRITTQQFETNRGSSHIANGQFFHKQQTTQNRSIGVNRFNTYLNKEEEEKLPETPSKCVICFDRDPDSVFMPCGHGGCCHDCAMLIFQSKNICYMCRKPIKIIFRVQDVEDDPQIVAVVDTLHREVKAQ